MTTWTNQELKEGAPSISYEETGVSYNDASYNYEGVLTEQWTNQTKN